MRSPALRLPARVGISNDEILDIELTIEHMFDSVGVVELVLDLLDLTVDELAGADLHALTVDELAGGVVRVQATIDRLRAAHARLVVEADRARVWAPSGAKNMADWLAGKTNTSRRDAHQSARLGETMDRHQGVADAVADGEMSTATADAIADALNDPPKGADPAELIERAKGVGPVEARRRVEEWREEHRTETAKEASARRYAKRSFTKGPVDDGMVVIRITLPELEAKVFERAVADASGGFTEADDRSTAQLFADGVINLAELWARGSLTGGRARPSIIATAQLSTLLGDDDLAGLSADGCRVPADVLRRLVLNAEIQLLIKAGEEILWLGRTVRYATDAQFKALLERDGGCRFPGCEAPAGACEIDHLDEWTLANGSTDLDRLVLWCPAHHRFRHRSDVSLEGTWHDLHLRMPDGTHLACLTKRRQHQAAA